MKITCIAGARPNFMKVMPVLDALEAVGHESELIHTGQHYDAAMSEIFFTDLGLRPPDVHLGVGSGSHAEQTAKVMVAFEKHVEEGRPDWVAVVGDVNSTLACALVAAKAHCLDPGGYGLLTLHRPPNVDDPAVLSGLIEAVSKIAVELPIVFPAHPRTISQLPAGGLHQQVIVIAEGLPRLSRAPSRTPLVLTDSGGIQAGCRA